MKHQKGHPSTEKSKEITETKLYKKAASHVFHGALNNSLSQYCLVWLAVVNFMSTNKSSEKIWTYNKLGTIVTNVNHQGIVSNQLSKTLNV